MLDVFGNGIQKHIQILVIKNKTYKKKTNIEDSLQDMLLKISRLERIGRALIHYLSLLSQVDAPSYPDLLLQS